MRNILQLELDSDSRAEAEHFYHLWEDYQHDNKRLVSLVDELIDHQKDSSQFR
jgi:hypothetical protein